MSQNKMRLTRGELTDMVGRLQNNDKFIINMFNLLVEHLGETQNLKEFIENKQKEAKKNEKDEK